MAEPSWDDPGHLMGTDRQGLMGSGGLAAYVLNHGVPSVVAAARGGHRQKRYSGYAREIEAGRVIAAMEEMKGVPPFSYAGGRIPNAAPAPHIRISDRGLIVRLKDDANWTVTRVGIRR